MPVGCKTSFKTIFHKKASFCVISVQVFHSSATIISSLDFFINIAHCKFYFFQDLQNSLSQKFFMEYESMVWVLRHYFLQLLEIIFLQYWESNSHHYYERFENHIGWPNLHFSFKKFYFKTKKILFALS